MFTAPRWLRDLGRSAWLLAGVFLILAGLTWLLGATSTIVDPMIAAVIVATVAMPVVSGLQRHRVPRAAGALLVLLLILTAAVVIAVLVIGGITAQQDEISGQLSAAVDKSGGWLDSLMILVNVQVHGGHDPEELLRARPLVAGVDPAGLTGVLAGLTGF